MWNRGYVMSPNLLGSRRDSLNTERLASVARREILSRALSFSLFLGVFARVTSLINVLSLLLFYYKTAGGR